MYTVTADSHKIWNTYIDQTMKKWNERTQFDFKHVKLVQSTNFETWPQVCVTHFFCLISSCGSRRNGLQAWECCCCPFNREFPCSWLPLPKGKMVWPVKQWLLSMLKTGGKKCRNYFFSWKIPLKNRYSALCFLSHFLSLSTLKNMFILISEKLGVVNNI